MDRRGFAFRSVLFEAASSRSVKKTVLQLPSEFLASCKEWACTCRHTAACGQPAACPRGRAIALRAWQLVSVPQQQPTGTTQSCSAPLKLLGDSAGAAGQRVGWLSAWASPGARIKVS